MRKFARLIGLVDKPSTRKLHIGAIPLVGGVSICISIAQFIVFKPDVIPHSFLFLSSICILTVVGALDDKLDLDFKIRLVIQGLLSVAMIYIADIQLKNIGDIFGVGNIYLGSLSPIVTVIAVIAAINAFNMVDGIDGLLGGLAIVTFGSIAILLNVDSRHGLAYLCVIFIVAIVPYIAMNLGIFGKERKVFMGDAGSMMIGFTVIWLLLGASQDYSRPLMRPVTALWLIAVPLMDMAAIMIRRVSRGASPFKPDREHLHHIFQRLGFSSKQTLIIICMISSVYAGVGVYGELNGIRESWLFFGFVMMFIFYLLMISYVWRITSFLRRLLKAKYV